MIRVLLTSFEPFGDRAANSSLEVGRALAARPPRGVELEWLVLPVVAGECSRQTLAAVAQWEPALVLALGQCAGASAVRIERQAANLDHFATADNAGNLRRQTIVAHAPARIPTTIGVGRLLGELRRQGFAVEASDSAGTFVCNHLFYELLHHEQPRRRPSSSGFLHLPLLPEQVRRSEQISSLGLHEMAECVRQAIRASVDTLLRPDLFLPASPPSRTP